MSSKDYWQRVKDLLKQNEKTQIQLCSDVGICLPTMKSWQSNDRYPGSEESVKIAQYLNTTVEYLVTGKEPAVKDNSAELINAIQEVLNNFHA